MTRGRGRSGRNRIMPGDGKVAGREPQRVPAAAAGVGEWEPVEADIADRPNHDRRYLIEPAKHERELGWRPVADFATALAATVDWYVENEGWWQDILRRKGDLQIAWAGAR